MTDALAVVNPERRTTVDLPNRPDLLQVVEGWAGAEGYKLQASVGPTRTYQKGTGFLVAPMMAEFTQVDANTVRLTAWIRVNLFVRLMALFLIPSEMHVRSGGFRLLLPRNIARGALNKLLAQLGVQPIP